MPLLHAITEPLAAAATFVTKVVIKVVLRVVLAVVYCLVVAPLAILLRALRIDLIGLRRDDRAASYWHTRAPGAPRAPPAPRAPRGASNAGPP